MKKLETLKHPASARALEALGFEVTTVNGNIVALDYAPTGMRVSAGTYGNQIEVQMPEAPKTEKRYRVDILSEGQVVGSRLFQWDHEAEHFRGYSPFPQETLGPVTPVEVAIEE